MSILYLPIKLILIIARHFKHKRNINALVITCYYFYYILNNKLYKRNSSSAIYWAAKFRRAGTAQKAVPFVNINNLIKPLLLATGEGYIDIVCLLLKQGALINVPRKGESVLLELLWRGNTKIVKLLLEYRAEVKLVNRRIPLNTAISYGQKDIIYILWDAGAQLDRFT